MKRYMLPLALWVGGWMGSAAWAIAPGQTGELPQSGSWSGINWSWSKAGVYQWNTTWNGNWYVGSAVAIGPNYLLTAGHVNGNPTDYLKIGGVEYHAVESYVPPNDSGQSGPPDLRIIKLDKTLPSYNTLYTGTLSAGMPLTIIGFGQTGTVNGGWTTWTAGTEGTGRWGTNTIANPSYRLNSGGRSSEAFTMNLSDSPTAYEALAAGGDSGGGAFVKVGDQWQLAGIMTNSGGSTTWAVSVPHYKNWIGSVVPEPALLGAFPVVLLLMRRRSA